MVSAVSEEVVSEQLLDEAVASAKARAVSGTDDLDVALGDDVAVPAQSVVVAIDGSSFARAALAPAIEIAKSLGVALVLVQAATPAHNPYVGEDLEEQLGETDAQKSLHQAAAHARANGLDVAEVLVKRPLANSPAQSILRTAEAFHARVIVMATHGRTGLARAWHGSIADEVVHGTSVPVLLVRPDAADPSRAE